MSITRILPVPALGDGLLLSGCATRNGGQGRRNGEIVHRYFDEWLNRGGTRAADQLSATNLVLRHPRVTLKGPEACKQSMAAFLRRSGEKPCVANLYCHSGRYRASGVKLSAFKESVVQVTRGESNPMWRGIQQGVVDLTNAAKQKTPR